MGKNVANPTAMVLSASLMLRHLGLESQANSIASAVYDVMCVLRCLPFATPLTDTYARTHLQPRRQGPHRRHGRPGLDLGLHLGHHLQDLKTGPPIDLMCLLPFSFSCNPIPSSPFLLDRRPCAHSMRPCLLSLSRSRSASPAAGQSASVERRSGREWKQAT